MRTVVNALGPALAYAVALAPALAAAEPARPPALAQVGVDERVGAQLPLDLWFSDAIGRRVQLRD